MSASSYWHDLAEIEDEWRREDAARANSPLHTLMRALRENGKSLAEIARIVGRDPSTVLRAVGHDGGRT